MKTASPPENRNEILITILGSGTCVPSLRRSSCSVLMETAGKRILFDCGPGTMRRLLEAGTKIFDIDAIFLSHFHPDHSGELASFLFSSKYPDGFRRIEPLILAGGTGLKAFFSALKGVYGAWIDPGPDFLELREADTASPDHLFFDGFSVRTVPSSHNPESVAFRLETREFSAVYTGDTGFSQNIIDLAGRADIMICESALPDSLPATGHLTPSGAGKMAARARVRQLVLTHFYPECDDADLVTRQCRSAYDGPLILAEDLMRLRVTENGVEAHAVLSRQS